MSKVISLSKSKPWTPRAYQLRAMRFLEENGAAALFLDPGLGKTSIVLSTFEKMRRQGVARKMLVIAPLRVCQLVWRQEAAKWDHTKHMTVEVLHGRHKDKVFDNSTADVHVINREGVEWLLKKCRGKLPYDTVVFDELTKFKTAQGRRFKMLRGGKVGQRTYPNALANVARRWGLTGTPTPNGYGDLFGQMLILDDGATFGRYITHFRDQYFVPDFNGFDYKLQPGADKRIQAKLETIALRMSAEEYLELPPTITHVVEVDLDAKGKKAYKAMKDTMLLALEAETITAANAAVVSMLLEQLANGAIYMPEEKGKRRRWEEVHTAKLDALEELVSELEGQPLIIAYQFKHDLERIRARLGDVPVLTGSDTEIAALEAAWNRNEIPIMLCHPDSVGHGLNLQGGNACHIAWFSPTWNFENYEQLIGRLRRSGNEASRIMNYVLAVRGSVDFLKIKALEEKDNDQTTLLKGLTGILHATELDYDVSLLTNEENEEMTIRKLTRPGANVEQPAAEERPRPAGWGQRAAPPAETEEAPPQEETRRPAGWGNRQQISTNPENRQEVEEEVAGQDTPSLFSGAVGAALNGESDEEPDRPEPVKTAELDRPEPAKRTRRTVAKEKVDTAEATFDYQNVATPASFDGPLNSVPAHRPGATISINIHGTAAEVRSALKELLNT